ncbi:hypothetical protein EMCRGX_G003941 [Ephydatia muelleri]
MACISTKNVAKELRKICHGAVRGLSYLLSVPEEESALVHTSPEDSGEGDDDEGTFSQISLQHICTSNHDGIVAMVLYVQNHMRVCRYPGCCQNPRWSSTPQKSLYSTVVSSTVITDMWCSSFSLEIW